MPKDASIDGLGNPSTVGDPAVPRDLLQPHHLPNLRPRGEAPDPSWLPLQRRGVTPQMIGRYPDYDVFDARTTWDRATSELIDERMKVKSGAALVFFSPGETATLRAFCDICVAQDSDPRVPVVELIDEKLAANRLDGYQYDDMPDDRETWKIVLQGLDEVAKSRYGRGSFSDCDGDAKSAIVASFSRAELSGGSFDKVNVARAWSVCMRMILAAFYAHPWAWNEIGFGGPAYPRGYMRLGPTGILEPFERSGATSEDPVRVEEADH